MVPEMAIESRERCRFIPIADENAFRRVGIVQLKATFPEPGAPRVSGSFKRDAETHGAHGCLKHVLWHLADGCAQINWVGLVVTTPGIVHDEIKNVTFRNWDTGKVNELSIVGEKVTLSQGHRALIN